ncbi:MAG: YfjI family protein [Rhodobacteraceae bacterium]|nr:YfjI family protein [Paracoccaceae bacterium]
MADVIQATLAAKVRFLPEAPRPLVRKMAEAEPYPIEALGPLRSPVLAIQEHTQAPLALCAQAVIGAVALVSQAHCNVELPSGQVKPLSLFLLTIAGSGERKSGVDALALQAIYEREEELQDAYRLERSEHETAVDIWESKRAQAKAEIKSTKRKPAAQSYDGEADLRALGSEPEAPLAPILVCPEPTFEGYCKLTANGLPALGLYSAEGGGFIGGFGMTGDQRLKTAAGISSVWDGEPIKRVRAGDGSVVLAGRRLSVHLMAQPAVAAQMLNDDLLLSQGLLSRFLVAAPQSTAGNRQFAEASLRAKADLELYRRRLAEMVRADQPLKPNTRNVLAPRKLVLTGEAKTIWIGLHDFIEKQLPPEKDFHPISGLANKGAEHAARLAGVLTLWENLT